jgi:hypothetical protein
VPASATQIVRVFRTPGLSEAKEAALLAKARRSAHATRSRLAVGHFQRRPPRLVARRAWRC